MESPPKTLSFSNEQEYLEFVIETTQNMLGIMNKEKEHPEAFSDLDKAQWIITEHIVTQIQGMSTLVLNQSKYGDLSLPTAGLVGPNGEVL